MLPMVLVDDEEGRVFEEDSGGRPREGEGPMPAAVDVVAEPPPSKSMGFDGSSVATDGVGVETVPRRMLLEAQSMYSRYAPLPSRLKLQIGAGGRRGTVLITDPFFRAKVNLKREIMM